MASFRSDPSSSSSSSSSTRIHPDPYPHSNDDHFDRIPDSLVLLIFNYIADVKSLGRCSLVSKRFHSLVPLVHHLLLRVDCVISDDDHPSSTAPHKSRSLLRALLSNIFKPLHALITKRPTLNAAAAAAAVTHHSPAQVLKNFTDIKFLRIELPSGELGIDDGVLLTWRAHFGSTLDHCVILGASSLLPAISLSPRETEVNGEVNSSSGLNEDNNNNNNNNNNGSMPESFYTNGGLKLRVVWTISSLIAASARHYLLQPIIGDHQTLDSLVLTDADGQGVLCMNKEQLEELRVKPLSASAASKRTLVPALNMRLWYAPHLELSDGTVLKGATLVAIRPSDQTVAGKKDISDLSWVSNAFDDGPYGTAAKMLVKRRTYCLEMNSF